MARSDLFSAAQNAQKVFAMIKDMSEEEGLDGWVQEKIIKANDYLNTIREYLEGKQLQHESKFGSGVIGNGAMGEGYESSANYAEQLAQKVFNVRPSLASEDDVLNIGYKVAVQDLASQTRAVSLFSRDQDFPSDFVSAYRYLQKRRGVTEGEDEGIRPQGRILKRLRDIAIMSPTLTFQNFRQSGKEAIITDAMMACKIMKRHFLQNKNQPTAQFIHNLENEIYDFMRGRKLDTPDGNAYTMDLSDLSRGTLGKMQFQTKEGVAEVEENKYGSQENWDSLRKDIRGQYPYKKGTTVTVPHKGKLVNGKIVRYEAGEGGYSPAYVVDIGEYESIMVQPNKVRRGVTEGAKVDRMVKHIEKSEKKLGKSKDEAENIAWATANKRGMLNNKNKKA
jgi:hypothetical protein